MLHSPSSHISSTEVAPVSTYTPSLLFPSPSYPRYSAILNECLERLDLLSLLLNRSSSTDSSSSEDSSQTLSLLNRQSLLEEQYSKLHQYRSTLTTGLTNKSILTQTNNYLNNVTVQLQQSMKNVSDSINRGNNKETNHQIIEDTRKSKLKNDFLWLTQILQTWNVPIPTHSTSPNPHSNSTPPSPNESFMRKNFPTNQTSNISLFEHKLQESIINFNAYLNKKTLHDETVNKINQLKAQIQQSQQHFETLTASKNHELLQLQSKIKHIEKQQKHSSIYSQQQAVAKIEAVARLRAYRLDELKKALLNAKLQLKTSHKANKHILLHLQEEKVKIENNIENWNTRYEEEIKEVMHGYEEMKRERREEINKIINLQDRWAIEAERKKKEILERKEKLLSEQAEIDRKIKEDLAVRKIQFFWRCYWRRRKVELIKLKKQWMKKQKAAKKGQE